MTKRIIALAICLLLVFSFTLSSAETIYANLSEMTPTELRDLENKVSKEYDNATELPSGAYSKLEDQMDKAIKSKFPTATSISYPFFGLSTSRTRSMIKIYGDCSVKFADKSKLSYEFTGYFWYNEAKKTYDLALLLADKQILIENDEVLANIAEYLESSVVYLIGEEKVKAMIPAREAAYMVVDGPMQVSAETSSEAAVSYDFSTATDEELLNILDAVKAEQRARIKTKVVLSDTELTLDMKTAGSKKITAEVTDLPEGVKVSSYTWATSDKSVATCSSNGFVQAVSSGNAVITCSANLSDGTVVEADCKVAVIVKVSSIDFEKNNITIGLQETYTIVPIVRPNNATDNSVRYESSDSSVASVDANGVVTGIGAGNAVITVTAMDGSGKSNTFRVKVAVKSEIGVAKTSSDDITVTIDRVSTHAGNFLATPKSGNTFLIISYTISNNSKSTHTVSYTNFSAYSNSYKLDIADTIWLCDDYSFLDDLEPGGKIRGQIAIEVEKNWREISLKYETSSWFGDTIQFSLYNQ